jgi:hypothetical protein
LLAIMSPKSLLKVSQALCLLYTHTHIYTSVGQVPASTSNKEPPVLYSVLS